MYKRVHDQTKISMNLKKYRITSLKRISQQTICSVLTSRKRNTTNLPLPANTGSMDIMSREEAIGISFTLKSQRSNMFNQH